MQGQLNAGGWAKVAIDNSWNSCYSFTTNSKEGGSGRVGGEGGQELDVQLVLNNFHESKIKSGVDKIYQ